jgi:hypothetical protein
MNDQRNYEVLWSALPTGTLPHKESFTNHNPGIKQHTCKAPDGPRKYNWLNSDRCLRDWFKNNKYTNTLILEYDVFVNKNLTNEPFNNKVLIKNILHPLNSNHERIAKELPELLRPYALFCSVLGVVYLPKEAIDALINPIYDEIYERSFHCEMRIFTVLNHAGFRPIKWQIPHVHGKRADVFDMHNAPSGIHHPVKTA